MTMDTRRISSAGFSTAEALVATALLLTVTATMLSAYRFNLFAFKRQEAQLDVQETARSLIDLIAREIRQAGADPTCVKTFEGIAEAGTRSLRIQADRSGDGVLQVDENVAYNFNPDARDIGRTVGGVRTLLISNVSGEALNFSYFDGGGAVLAPSGTPPTLSAAQRTAVRRVRISVHLERSLAQPLGSMPVVSEMVTNVDVRNRFLNSGVGCP
jgi:hypothetical protein